MGEDARRGIARRRLWGAPVTVYVRARYEAAGVRQLRAHDARPRRARVFAVSSVPNAPERRAACNTYRARAWRSSDGVSRRRRPGQTGVRIPNHGSSKRARPARFRRNCVSYYDMRKLELCTAPRAARQGLHLVNWLAHTGPTCGTASSSRCSCCRTCTPSAASARLVVARNCPRWNRPRRSIARRVPPTTASLRILRAQRRESSAASCPPCCRSAGC